ncbi:MAG TPA: glycosyltransferase family 2 protein [Vicinamibacterales bacterium]|nr:glycosyltransferase family 2 protein [Vicinamibacterales bacterium]
MADVILWCSVALVIYAYLGYPCALLALAAIRTRPVRKGRELPLVSFIITAHNEDNRIAAKIENTLAQDYPVDRHEIIVASDCSTDRTDAIAGGYAPRVRLVRTAERHGKEAAQRLAIEASRGDILVFSDVATALAPGGVSSLVRNFSDATVGCVSSVDRSVDAAGRVSGEGAYVRYEMFLRRLETAVNSLVGLSGSLFAARRDVCRRWAADRQSDFSTLLNAVELGYRGVLDPDSVGYYSNIDDERREFQRKVRTVVRGLAVLASNARMLNPLRYGIFAWQLASHKLCRWLVPFAMIAALVSNAALAPSSVVYELMLALQLSFYAAALGGLRTRSAALRIPAFLLLVNVAALTAWIRYVRGQRIIAWTPSERTPLPQIPLRG